MEEWSGKTPGSYDLDQNVFLPFLFILGNEEGYKTMG